MRQQSVNYFVGSLFSKQILYAYGIAGAATTIGQLLLIWLGIFSGAPLRTDTLPVAIEVYIETLLPLWIPPVTGWNVFVFLVNLVLALWLLASWTYNYERAL